MGMIERIDVQRARGEAASLCQADDLLGPLEAVSGARGHRGAGAGEDDGGAALAADLEDLGPLHRGRVHHGASAAGPGRVDVVEARLEDRRIR